MADRSNQFDSIVIGASPTGLFEAAALAEGGARVLVVDQSDRLGGAWTTLELPDIGTVECGSHYLIDMPHVYSFLEEALDLKLELLDPPAQYVLPRSVMFRRRVDFTQRWGAKISPRLQKNGFSFRGIRNLISPYYRWTRHKIGLEGAARKPLKFIPGGTPELVEALNRFAGKGGFEIALGERLANVELSVRDRVVRGRVADREIVASELVAPSCALLSEVIVDGERVELPGEIIPSVQLHMVVGNAARRRMTLVQFSGSDHANLASDLTDTCLPPLGPNRRLLSAYVRTEARHDDQTAIAVLDQLKRADLLEQDAVLVAAHWSRFDLPQRSLEELTEIEKASDGLIRALYTHSFSTAISENAPRWRPLLRKRARRLDARGKSETNDCSVAQCDRA